MPNRPASSRTGRRPRRTVRGTWRTRCGVPRLSARLPRQAAAGCRRAGCRTRGRGRRAADRRPDGQRSRSSQIRANARVLMRVSCRAASALPSGVCRLPRSRQVSPTTPCSLDELSGLEDLPLADRRPAHDQLDACPRQKAPPGPRPGRPATPPWSCASPASLMVAERTPPDDQPIRLAASAAPSLRAWPTRALSRTAPMSRTSGLKRSAIAEALGSGGRAKGTRAVASYDEDSTSMGVEAARNALRAAPDGAAPASLVFATTSPPYLDKTNATAIHAALDLPRSTAAYDAVGSVRSTAGSAPVGVQRRRTDARRRLGRPHGPARWNRGGEQRRRRRRGPVRERYPMSSPSSSPPDRQPPSSSIGGASPATLASRQWEERFGEVVYVPLAEAGVHRRAEAGRRDRRRDRPRCASPASTAGRPGRWPRRWASGPRRSPTTSRRRSATPAQPIPRSCSPSILDSAKPGALDRARHAVRRGRRVPPPHHRRARRPAEHGPSRRRSRQGNDSLTYPAFLTWRGMPRPGAAPPARPCRTRGSAVARGARRGSSASPRSKCEACGTRHLPPARVCVKCDAVDQMTSERLADVAGHRRHVHDRPVGVLAQPAGRRRRYRLRWRWPHELRADRRRPVLGADRRPGGDDLPPAVHRPGHPQLFLEGMSGKAARSVTTQRDEGRF